MHETLIDDEAASRFELAFGDLVAFVDYRRAGEVLVLTHAEVPPSLQGRGVGAQLVQAVLERVRARGQTVVPRCPFIARYVERHPEFGDLVATRP
jgi:predicted GNAT family acetyltransferase